LFTERLGYGKIAFKQRFLLEPVTGIEPAHSAWEAISTPERIGENAWSAA
jgi:hypothetical protein